VHLQVFSRQVMGVKIDNHPYLLSFSCDSNAYSAQLPGSTQLERGTQYVGGIGGRLLALIQHRRCPRRQTHP
jgi:hypothetical protein